MASTVNDALKDLYLACGGDPSKLTDNHEVSDYIRDLSSVLTGGGSGESDMVVVTFYDEWDEQEEKFIYKCDKTFDEILQAATSNKVVLGRYCDAGMSDPPKTFYYFLPNEVNDYTTMFNFIFTTSEVPEIEGENVYYQIVKTTFSINNENAISISNLHMTFEGRGYWDD